MSAIVRVRFGAMAAGLACLLLSVASAAETDPVTGKVIPSQSLDNTKNRGGQIDRATTPEPGARPLRGQPYTANFGAAQANGAQAGQDVERYLANCLLDENKGEVELSRFAEQHSQNPQVKQFAAQMVKDHQQLVQKLEQITGAQSATSASNSRLDLNATTGTDQTTLGATGPPAGATAGDTAQPTRPATGNDINRENNPTAAGDGMGMNGSLGQLAAIEQKINERCQQAFREELQQKSGNEFDESFLGAQVGGHMHMLAALEVISQENQGQLKQLADEARPTVQKHLEHAKDLMKQAKSGDSASARTERSATTNETQR